MLTDDDLPPLPKFSVKKWLVSGFIAWSLFFGAVGGLGVLLLADFGPDKVTERILPTREIKRDVANVDQRVTALEQRTDKLHDQQKTLAQLSPQAPAQPQPQDNTMARIMIGITQLKTAYDNDTSLSDGIATLKTNIKNVPIQQTLDELQKVTTDNFPSKEKILDDLQTLQAPSNQNLRNEKGDQPLDWRSRAKLAVSQLVTVTPTRNVVNDKQVDRVQQLVANGDYDLAQKFAQNLPANPMTKVVLAEITARTQAQMLVERLVNQVSAAVTGSNGSLY